MIGDTDFRYSWERCGDEVILRISGGTFTIPHESYSVLNDISTIEVQTTITSKYNAKITLSRVLSVSGTYARVVLSFFDSWGDALGVYFIPVPLYNDMILCGYAAMIQLVKI